MSELDIRININNYLNQVDESFLKVVHSMLETYVKEHQKDVNNDALTKENDTFWTYIDLIDWSKTNHQERLKALVDKLATSDIPTIHDFSEQLAFYLHQLDGPAYFEALKNREEGVSSDTFLYARCMVIAKGKTFYIDVLDHPVKMPTGEDFEALLYVDEQAFEQKTGEKYDYVPSINYESFFNKNLWKEQAITL